MLLAAVAILAHTVTALPNKPATTNFCSTVKKIVTAAGAESVATAFCSSYLSIPVATSTTTTTPKASTTTTTVTVHTSPPEVTQTSTVTNTITPAPTSTTVTVGAGTTTVTSTTGTCPAVLSPKRKRNSSPKPKPSCLTTYSPGASLSSACSCLSIAKSTTTSTQTAPVPTSTITTTTTISDPAHTTTTIVTTQTTLPQQTSTITVSVQATATAYSLSPPSCLTEDFPGLGGPLDGEDRNIDIKYTYYFSGCSVALNPVNPGGRLGVTKTFPASYSACDAIAACAHEGAQGPDEKSFTVSRTIATGEWQCLGFVKQNGHASYFNVPDDTVSDVYGYTSSYPGFSGCPSYQPYSFSNQQYSGSSADC